MKDLIARIEGLAISNHNLSGYINEHITRETNYLNQIDELKESLETMTWMAKDYEKERNSAYMEIESLEFELGKYIKSYGELDAD